MKTYGEEELIAYHLGELSWWKKKLLQRRLAVDAELAADSEEIAETLRQFTADPAPAVSEALLERSWQRVRSSLSALDPPPHSRRIFVLAAITSAVVIAIVATVAISHLRAVELPPTTAENAPPAARNWSERLLSELRRENPDAELYNRRSGPLTVAPVDAVAEDPALATHIDAAERVLTEVSHAEGTLQPETREQVHRLLLENAVYRQAAQQHGDMETAAVIDDLGRVLTSLDAEPLNARRRIPSNSDAFRLEVNLAGVLLDLRILHYSDRSNKNR